MGAREEIHVGDWGTNIDVTLVDDGTPVNISAATTRQYKLKSPAGDVAVVNASFITDGTDGKLRHTLANPSIITVAGRWELQVRVAGAGGDWHSDKYEFLVYENLS